MTNMLLRLANKSGLPPHALYSIHYTNFFSISELNCLKSAGI